MSLNKPRQNLLLRLNTLELSFSLIISIKMNEFHCEDPDLKHSTLEIGFPSRAVEKDSFIDSQGEQIRMENMESFQAELRK